MTTPTVVPSPPDPLSRSVGRGGVVAVAALLLAVLAGVASLPGLARADATVELSQVENGYPKELTFRLTANATVDITDVTLNYRLTGRNSTAFGKPEPGDLTPGKRITTTVKVETNPNSNWIPIGNEFTYSWEITLADGTVTNTKEEKFFYLPPGNDWKSVTNERFAIWYTGPREALANRMRDALETVYQDHGQKLLKTDIPRKPVKVIIMGDANALQEAQPSKGSTFDNSRVVVTCGFRPGSADDIILGTVSCGGSDPLDTMRHEFGHILNASAGESTLVKLPVWVDEGLAVYAQDREDEYTATFEAAKRRNSLIPFRQMSAPIADQNRVILQYGQSFAMVKYLLDKYGQAKLNELLAATKGGTRFDAALKGTYGFDIDGFEQEFTAAQGVSGSASTPTVRPQQQPTAGASPTAQRSPAGPTPTPRAPATATSDDDDGGISRLTIAMIGGAVLLMLFAILAFLGLMFAQNQRTGTGRG